MTHLRVLRSTLPALHSTRNIVLTHKLNKLNFVQSRATTCHSNVQWFLQGFFRLSVKHVCCCFLNHKGMNIGDYVIAVTFGFCRQSLKMKIGKNFSRFCCSRHVRYKTLSGLLLDENNKPQAGVMKWSYCYNANVDYFAIIYWLNTDVIGTVWTYLDSR